MSMVGQREPEWKALAWQKGEEKELSSKDYEGKWHILYWYPLDFTFVCPTEIKGFQEHLEDFKEEGIEIIGVSTDSWHSHNAWFKDRSTFPQEITHPVIADTNHHVTRTFGVLKEDEGVAYRATVIVDKEGVIRSYQVNDKPVGRSPSEILRTAQALQTGGLCGADWKPGDGFVG